MKVRDLTRDWASARREQHVYREMATRLPLHRAAQLAALADMFADGDESRVIADLLIAALGEVEASFPYVQGQKSGEDEFGDPVYADAGHTPRFHALTRAHFERMQRDAGIPPQADRH